MQNLKVNIDTKQNMKVTVQGNHNLKNKIKNFRKHFTVLSRVFVVDMIFFLFYRKDKIYELMLIKCFFVI